MEYEIEFETSYEKDISYEERMERKLKRDFLIDS